MAVKLMLLDGGATDKELPSDKDLAAAFSIADEDASGELFGVLVSKAELQETEGTRGTLGQLVTWKPRVAFASSRALLAVCIRVCGRARVCGALPASGQGESRRPRQKVAVRKLRAGVCLCAVPFLRRRTF